MSWAAPIHVGQADVLQKTGENPHALLIQVGELRKRVDELVAAMGSGEATAPEIFQEVSKLQIDVVTLETDAAKLDQGHVSIFEMFSINYPFLLTRFKALAAQYETYNVGPAPPPPETPPVYQPPRTSSPVLWVLGGLALLGLGALYMVKS